MTPDTCHSCEHVVGRLSVELAKEIRRALAMELTIAFLQQKLDQLEHERAVDSGPAIVAEVETWLADQGGGS